MRPQQKQHNRRDKIKFGYFWIIILEEKSRDWIVPYFRSLLSIFFVKATNSILSDFWRYLYSLLWDLLDSFHFESSLSHSHLSRSYSIYVIACATELHSSTRIFLISSKRGTFTTRISCANYVNTTHWNWTVPHKTSHRLCFWVIFMRARARTAEHLSKGKVLQRRGYLAQTTVKTTYWNWTVPRRTSHRQL